MELRPLEADERAILEHIVEDADAWWENCQNKLPNAELALNNKLAKYQPEHIEATEAAAPETVLDDEGVDITPDAIPYRNRAQRDADAKAAEEARITPMMKWEAEMSRLDDALMSDSRFWEELGSGIVSPSAQTRHDAIVVDRATHRLARP